MITDDAKEENRNAADYRFQTTYSGAFPRDAAFREALLKRGLQGNPPHISRRASAISSAVVCGHRMTCRNCVALAENRRSDSKIDKIVMPGPVGIPQMPVHEFRRQRRNGGIFERHGQDGIQPGFHLRGLELLKQPFRRARMTRP